MLKELLEDKLKKKFDDVLKAHNGGPIDNEEEI